MKDYLQSHSRQWWSKGVSVCKANVVSNPQCCFKREDETLYTENGVTESYQGGKRGKTLQCGNLVWL